MSCSANPTLAAIQRAKSQRADAGDVGSRKSLDHVGVRKSVDLVATARAPAPSSPAAKAVITEAGGHNSEGVKNVFGAVDGHSDKGWWAHTDAGQMNAEDELVKTLMQGQSKAPQVPSLDAALGPKKGLDYSALFAERAVEEPAPSASSQPITQAAATPAPTAALATCTSGAEPVPPEQQAIQPGPHHGSAVKLQGGPWQEREQEWADGAASLNTLVRADQKGTIAMYKRAETWSSAVPRLPDGPSELRRARCAASREPRRCVARTVDRPLRAEYGWRSAGAVGRRREPRTLVAPALARFLKIHRQLHQCASSSGQKPSGRVKGEVLGSEACQ
ncbi:hypothetical protein QJQ45_013561 [Haematococcus lacustris]|nr:hypothetical protein QJQ45_013561 [Haematococcus lacustris]